MTSIDPDAVARDIAARSILEGARERGAVGQSDDGLVKVLVAKNGDLQRISIDPSLAPGADLRQLERSIILSYRRANREIYTAMLDELARTTGVTPHPSMYQVVAERFREPTPRTPETGRN